MLRFWMSVRAWIQKLLPRILNLEFRTRRKATGMRGGCGQQSRDLSTVKCLV